MTETAAGGVDGDDAAPASQPDAAFAGDSPALAPPADSASRRVDVICPFLISATGDFRLAAPSREHRCAAFVPLTSLSLEKQSRLCLAAAHATCATFVASVAAREARVGSGQPDARTSRWGYARTAPLVEDTGGLLGTLITMVGDRRTWPAIPAVLLVATLIAVGISGIRTEGPAAAVATATPRTTPPGPTPEPTPETSSAPTAEPSVAPTQAPSVAPSVGPSTAPAPAPSYLIYTVKSGDTLASIAIQFHTTISAIEQLNGITDPRHLHIGQKLKIP
ncbi:MAG TPA: LysM peptidoglycan-binding domain-containing protein [Candidatus Limnocylindrales bacterium]|nr:LysM peptidoglycan-binding domain-containing protein [Candidatus Limnocylindrales bacterium]